MQQFVQQFVVWILSVRGLDFFISCADSAALSGAPLSSIPRSLLMYGTGVEGDGDETRRRKVISDLMALGNGIRDSPVRSILWIE